MPIQIVGADKGPCALCLSDREKKLFVLSNPGYPSRCCGDHLHVLAAQLGNGKPEEAPGYGEVQGGERRA